MTRGACRGEVPPRLRASPRHEGYHTTSPDLAAREDREELKAFSARMKERFKEKQLP